MPLGHLIVTHYVRFDVRRTQQAKLGSPAPLNSSFVYPSCAVLNYVTTSYVHSLKPFSVLELSLQERCLV